MPRSDMSDLEWEFIKAVLPNNSRGVKRVDDRRVITAISMSCAPASHGVICRINTVPTQRFITVSIVGHTQASGTGSWRPWPMPTTWTL